MNQFKLLINRTSNYISHSAVQSHIHAQSLKLVAKILSVSFMKWDCNQLLTRLQILHSQQRRTEIYLQVEQHKKRRGLNSKAGICIMN